MEGKRSYYLDYLRVLSILLLFPVHTFMIWNDYGQKFYVWDGDNRVLSSLINLINPWFMSILFIIAGMSTRYSLEKRTIKQFISERVKKLLIPFVSGVILLVPFQTLYARKFFYEYSGSIFDSIIYFFTHFTDLTGYDGAFTPGHLWFILFLFIISLIGILIGKLLPYETIQSKINSINIYIIVLMFALAWGGYYIGKFGVFSIGRSLVLYLLGYYVLSDNSVLKLLDKYHVLLMILFGISLLLLVVTYYKYSYYGDGLTNFVGWVGSCALISFAMKYLNQRTKFIEYFSKASFPIYILHQSILVIIGYYTLYYINGIFPQVVVIMVLSFIITLILYEIIKRIPYVRFLLGIK